MHTARQRTHMLEIISYPLEEVSTKEEIELHVDFLFKFFNTPLAKRIECAYCDRSELFISDTCIPPNFKTAPAIIKTLCCSCGIVNSYTLLEKDLLQNQTGD